MKIALLLSGMVRGHRQVDGEHEGYDTDWRVTRDNLRNTLINPYSPDIFIHTWTNEDTPSVMNYYNPKEYVIEDQPSFNPSFNDELLTAHSKDKDAFYRSNNNPLVYANPHTWTQGYGIYKANSLRQKYAAANNIQYDLVVRARFDIAFANAIHLEPNKLQFCGYRPMDGGIDDVFFAGGEKDMNIICDMYNHLYELYSDSDWSNRMKNMGYPVAYYYTSHPIFWNYLTLNSLTDKITYPGWIRDHTFRLIRTNIQRPR